MAAEAMLLLLLLEVVKVVLLPVEEMAAAEVPERYQQLYPLHCKVIVLDHALALTDSGNYTNEYHHKISSDHHRSSSMNLPPAVDLGTS